MSSCCNIYDEYCRAIVHARSKGNNAEVAAIPPLAYDDYLMHVTQKSGNGVARV